MYEVYILIQVYRKAYICSRCNKRVFIFIAFEDENFYLNRSLEFKRNIESFVKYYAKCTYLIVIFNSYNQIITQ